MYLKILNIILSLIFLCSILEAKMSNIQRGLDVPSQVEILLRSYKILIKFLNKILVILLSRFL